MKYFYTTVVVMALLCTNVNGQQLGNYYFNMNNRFDNTFTYKEVNPGNQNGDKLMIPNTPYMELEVSALYNAKTTDYVAIFNITQLGKTAMEVDSLVNMKIKGLMDGLEAADVTDVSITTDMVSILPVYEYEVTKKIFSKTYQEVPAGFELQKNLHVHYTKAGSIDKIMTLAAQNEIYELVKVDYFTRNIAQINDTLRKLVADFLLSEVENFESLGIRFDSMARIATQNTKVTYPAERYKAYTSFVSGSLASKKEIREGAIDHIRKPKTMFYNLQPYYNYDIVVNPVVTEPVIQYAHTIKIRLPLEKLPPKAREIVKNVDKHHYKVVFPDGQIKELHTEAK